MASDRAPVSFDSIIQAGRDRKKAEELASSIFSKNRHGRNSPAGPKKRLIGSPSLASRITKVCHLDGIFAHINMKQPVHRSGSSSSISQSRIETAYEKTSKVNGYGGGYGGGQGFSIKGAAGPYAVVGSNFAPGTSAADIRSAMEQVAGEIMSCMIITSYPTVIAEIVFAEKETAEMIVTTFNNQKVCCKHWMKFTLTLYRRTGVYYTFISRLALQQG